MIDFRRERNMRENLVLRIQNRLDNLTKPKSSLGELENIALRLGIMQKSVSPRINKKGVIVFAGDHGVVKHGVSAFPQAVTVQMVYNFLAGGAAINVLANYIDAKIFIVDAGVNFDFPSTTQLISNKIMNGTGDLYKEDAMTLAQAKKNVQLGKAITKKILKENSFDIIAIGEMGIGNTTSASIISGCICKMPAMKITGRGTGIDDKSLNIKRKIIGDSLKKIRNISDPYRILSAVGGCEIAQICGALLACRESRVAVAIDGVICTAGALLAQMIDPKTTDFMFAGHKSAEPAHIYALKKLGLKPILDLGMRLGEGTGGVLSIAVIEASTKIINEMATFSQAGVSGKL